MQLQSSSALRSTASQEVAANFSMLLGWPDCEVGSQDCCAIWQVDQSEIASGPRDRI